MLQALPHHPDPAVAGFLDLDAPLTVGRAPGRLDVMGGIADYSGSLVLELPLARATWAVVQATDDGRCEVASLGAPSGRATPTGAAASARHFAVDFAHLRTGDLTTPEALRSFFSVRGSDAWAAYLLGVVHFCLHRTGHQADPRAAAPATPAPGGATSRDGLRILVTSEVPEGKGVASSAALEVAAMSALASAWQIPIEPTALALACQWVENHVVGAPCGVMDQMTSALGEADALLRLRCQPAEVEGHVAIPSGYRFYGIDSGIRHAVSGASYGTVRTAAFMGRALLRAADPDGVPGGYLANVTPAAFDGSFADRLPERMRGCDFLRAHPEGTGDPVTTVDPDREYPVRAATLHPIRENARVERFAELLAELPDADAAREMGEAMVASHESYGECGLGSDGTDRLVEMVMEAGPARGVYGAKITGGGNGGTVAVFGTTAAAATVRAIAARYREETGRSAEVFDGSGPGAAASGVLNIHPGRTRP
jgi:L-arabinokinase